MLTAVGQSSSVRMHSPQITNLALSAKAKAGEWGGIKEISTNA